MGQQTSQSEKGWKGGTHKLSCKQDLLQKYYPKMYEKCKGIEVGWETKISETIGWKTNGQKINRSR